jgi:CRISPR/Cas system CMR-associated protein Cmr3 (group 5 of RAMP superfamily)
MIPEMRRMLSEAREKGYDKIVDFCGLSDPPQFTLSIQTPKVAGQNTQQFSGWDWRMQNLRKILHVVVKAEEVQYMQELFTIAKDTQILTKYYGPNARVVMIYDG